MFLPSQLAEISERFRPEVEDLQVFLQEEGLPVGSVECVQELSTRLGSDPRFRRDVGFLVRSMLGRERDEPAADEPGSMDVLAVLVVAAAGTRQEFETARQQQVIRELLRFVIQQRRPPAAPAVAVVDRPVATPPPISPPLAARRERPSPAPSAVAPHPVEVPLFFRAEEESSSRRTHAGWVVAVLAVLLIVGAGLMIWSGGSKTRTRNAVGVTTAPTPALPAYPTASAPERRVIVPPTSRSSHHVRKPSSPSTRASRRRAEPAQASLPQTVAANTPPLAANRLPTTIRRPEPLEPGPKLNQPVSAGTVQPLILHHDSAALSLPTDVRQRATPGSIDVSKVFAHPEAAAIATGSQVPPPAFHPSDPVLIRRNKPAAASEEPEPQGSVHTGSSGNMASSLMYSPDPEYPAQAIAAGVQGEVTVRAVVGPHGNVIDASVVSGPPLLREAALDAVGRWRFRPYEQDGKPVAIATTAIFDFQIPSTK